MNAQKIKECHNSQSLCGKLFMIEDNKLRSKIIMENEIHFLPSEVKERSCR